MPLKNGHGLHAVMAFAGNQKLPVKIDPPGIMASEIKVRETATPNAFNVVIVLLPLPFDCGGRIRQ